MAAEIKEAFQSMDLSTEHLSEVLEVAKQSDAKQLNEQELQTIEAMLHSLESAFHNFSARDIMQLKAVQGTCTGKAEKLQEIASQYQAMEALIANMTQSLMGLESVRNKFSQLHGSYASLLTTLQKSQSSAEASRLRLTEFSLNETKATIERTTEEFKKQLSEQITLFEVLGAEYYAMMNAAVPIRPPVGNSVPQPDENGDNANNAENNNDPTPEQANDQSAQAGETATAAEPTLTLEEEQEAFIPPPVVAAAGSETAQVIVQEEQQAFVPPPVASVAGSETHVAGAAPVGGAPAGPEVQAQGVGAAPVGAAPAGAAPAGPEVQAQGVGAAPVGAAPAGAAPAGPEVQAQGVGAAPVGAVPAGAAPAGPEVQAQGVGATPVGAAPTTPESHSANRDAMDMANENDRGRKDERQTKTTRKRASTNKTVSSESKSSANAAPAPNEMSAPAEKTTRKRTSKKKGE